MDWGRVEAVVRRLVDLMDVTGGYCYDTYDTRVGPVYLYLAQHRDSPPARLALYALYGIELAAPIVYRRLRGIPKTFDPMGNSYRAGVELTLYRLDGNPDRLHKAGTILNKVSGCAVGPEGTRGFALGFPCITGSNVLWSTSIPVAHYTIRVARKLLLWEQVARDGRHVPLLRETVRFLMTGLPWSERQGLLCVGYTPADPVQVVNIWADVASFLAAYDVQFQDAEARDRARGLATSVLAHQESSGAWPYFARWEQRQDWEDNTHTAMVLGALADLAICDPDLRSPIAPALERGVAHWIAAFFDEATGRHWNLTDRPRDAFTVCLGDTLYAINRLLRPEVGLAPATRARLTALEEQTIHWSLDHLLMDDGHFCERRLRHWRYALQSIRSFDGLSCDGLALAMARRRLGDAAVLWTQ